MAATQMPTFSTHSRLSPQHAQREPGVGRSASLVRAAVCLASDGVWRASGQQHTVGSATVDESPEKCQGLLDFLA